MSKIAFIIMRIIMLQSFLFSLGYGAINIGDYIMYSDSEDWEKNPHKQKGIGRVDGIESILNESGGVDDWCSIIWLNDEIQKTKAGAWKPEYRKKTKLLRNNCFAYEFEKELVIGDYVIYQEDNNMIGQIVAYSGEISATETKLVADHKTNEMKIRWLDDAEKQKCGVNFLQAVERGLDCARIDQLKYFDYEERVENKIRKDLLEKEIDILRLMEEFPNDYEKKQHFQDVMREIEATVGTDKRLRDMLKAEIQKELPEIPKDVASTVPCAKSSAFEQTSQSKSFAKEMAFLITLIVLFLTV